MDSSSPGTLERFFESCPALLFVTDRDGVILKKSRALSDILGPDPGERVTLADLTHPGDRNLVLGAWEALRGGAPPVPIEVRLRRADGSFQAFVCSAARSDDGAEIPGALHPAGGEGPELSLQAALFRQILDSVPACVWAVDQRGVFTFHDGKGLEAVNLKPGQLLGMNVYEIYAGTAGLPDIKNALVGESSHSFSESHGVRWESWFFPVRTTGGEVAFAAGFTIDVSEAKRVERELMAKLEPIEQQQSVIRSLSTPIIQVWDDVLTLPMMGAVSSRRTAEVMDSLLSEIVKTRARFAILDLTGVNSMDTDTAGHLVSLVRAIRLLGAEGIITGIQPAIAQTLAGLGVELAGIMTLSNLREGLRYCMRGMAK